jgi:hypothetical protein
MELTSELIALICALILSTWYCKLAIWAVTVEIALLGLPLLLKVLFMLVVLFRLLGWLSVVPFVVCRGMIS